MICYGSGTGTTRERVAVPVGMEAVSAGFPNREGISAHPIANLEGEFAFLHLLECGASVTEGMVNEAFAGLDLLFSVTPHGIQTGKSLLAFYQKFDRYLDEERDSEFGKWKVPPPSLVSAAAAGGAGRGGGAARRGSAALNR
jgi:hypothetical protein